MSKAKMPSIKTVSVGGKLRYRFVVDAGQKIKIDKATGKPILAPDGSMVMQRDQRTYTFDSEKEARSALGKIVSQRHEGTFIVPTKITIATLVNEWLASKRNLKDSTRRTYQDALKPVVTRLGNIQAQNLTKSQVITLVEWMRTEGRRVGTKQTKGLSGRSVNVTLTLLRSILADAEKQGRVARNVANLVDNESHRPQQTDTWTAQEAQQFLTSVASDRLQAAWILSLYGLRRGEVLGLRWTDVDFQAGTLTVAWTRGSVAGKITEDVPKTEKSRRTLPMDSALIQALRMLMATQSMESLVAGEAYQSTCPLCGEAHVVTDELGRPLVPPTYGHRFTRLAKAANLPVIRLHDARHTTGTLMHLRGVPTSVISAWLGHSSSAFTMSVYVHSQGPAVLQAGQTLAALIHADREM